MRLFLSDYLLWPCADISTWYWYPMKNLRWSSYLSDVIPRPQNKMENLWCPAPRATWCHCKRSTLSLSFINFHTFTLSLDPQHNGLPDATASAQHFHLHTFTFLHSFSHFHFHTFTWSPAPPATWCHCGRSTLSLSFIHFHTFTFTLSLDPQHHQLPDATAGDQHFHFPSFIFTLSLSHFQFHTFTWSPAQRATWCHCARSTLPESGELWSTGWRPITRRSHRLTFE